MISIITEDTDLIENYNSFYYKRDIIVNEKLYHILDDIEHIELRGNDIVLSIRLLSNETLKINSLKIPVDVEKYLNNIYITKNNNIIYKKHNYINNIINTQENTRLHLVFNKKNTDDIIGSNVIINYTIICKKSKSKACLLEDF